MAAKLATVALLSKGNRTFEVAIATALRLALEKSRKDGSKKRKKNN